MKMMITLPPQPPPQPPSPLLPLMHVNANQNVKKKSLKEKYWIETNKSFIFRIDENQMNFSNNFNDISIISRVKDIKHALRHSGQEISLNKNNIKFYEKFMNFYDLKLCNSVN